MWKMQTRIAAIAIFCIILFYSLLLHIQNIPSFINRLQNYIFFLISAKINKLFLPINRNNYYLCITINEYIIMNTIVIETSDVLEFDKVSKLLSSLKIKFSVRKSGELDYDYKEIDRLLSSADYDREHSLLKTVDIEHLWD